MQFVLIETVETIVESAQRNRVEGQTRHVVGDVDADLGSETLPAEKHLIGDVLHFAEHRAHPDRAESRHEDAVRLSPIRLFGIGGEQAIASDGAQLLKGNIDALGEAALVAQLINEFL